MSLKGDIQHEDVMVFPDSVPGMGHGNGGSSGPERWLRHTTKPDNPSSILGKKRIY